MGLLATVRVRGRVKMREDVETTLRMLRLTRVNYCSLLPDNETSRGMLQKAKDFITWGPVDGEDVALLLRSRGELVGGKKLTDDYMKGTRFGSEVFVQALTASEVLEIWPASSSGSIHQGRGTASRGLSRKVEPRGAGSIKDLLCRMRSSWHLGQKEGRRGAPGPVAVGPTRRVETRLRGGKGI